MCFFSELLNDIVQKVVTLQQFIFIVFDMIQEENVVNILKCFQFSRDAQYGLIFQFRVNNSCRVGASVIVTLHDGVLHF